MQTLELLNILHEEAQAFNAMAALEARLQESLVERRFLESESILTDMQLLSDEIVGIDARRELEFQRLKSEASLDDYDGLKDLLAILPSTDRELLAGAYRNIKIGVMRVKAASQGIDSYTRHHISVLKGVVDEYYPDRKQRTYTARGTHRETAAPLVLDRTL